MPAFNPFPLYGRSFGKSGQRPLDGVETLAFAKPHLTVKGCYSRKYSIPALACRLFQKRSRSLHKAENLFYNGFILHVPQHVIMAGKRAKKNKSCGS
ncbi:MAG: hypothetical protein B5M56_06660 [Desulfococcus sp. 4484_241]|nr:MAG: hypothetical protein B5M56_06660 [Desulfococcus sp. 4484_241]